MTSYLDAMRKYATFQGRATRTEYWMLTLFFWIGLIALFVGVFAFDPDLGGGNSDMMMGLFGIGVLVWVVAHILPMIATTVRRLHDFDASGWLYLLNFVPLANYVVWIVFGCIGPTPGANRYGADPRGGASLADLDAFGARTAPAFDPATGALVRG